MGAKYGITYQGSKDGIAESIITFLPPGNRFVDLFGGGALYQTAPHVRASIARCFIMSLTRF